MAFLPFLKTALALKPIGFLGVQYPVIISRVSVSKFI